MRKSVALTPKDGNHWNTLALAEYRVHHWTEAIAAAKQSIALRSGGSAVRLVLPRHGPRAEEREGPGAEMV